MKQRDNQKYLVTDKRNHRGESRGFSKEIAKVGGEGQTLRGTEGNHQGYRPHIAQIVCAEVSPEGIQKKTEPTKVTAQDRSGDGDHP